MTRTAVVVACLLLAGAVPLAASDHPQEGDSGETISFDHRAGNEWWVEVVVRLDTTEPENVHVDRVEARDENGPWVELSLKSWGAYAASFHIEPGHHVQFRAAQHGGMSDARVWTSCWFTHPAGVEQCVESPPPGTSPPPPAFTFQHGGGNEWWVEAKVSPMPGKVEAMDTGGAWVPLSYRHWGEWANSFHIEAGHQVKFRALAPDGAWHESCWYTHPAGTPATCGSQYPPANGTFDATFRNVRGNAWWVETDVSVTGGTLAGVDARSDGGAWIALEKKSWGSWARSFHVPEGAIVEFRARSTTGASDASGPYAWPPA